MFSSPRHLRNRSPRRSTAGTIRVTSARLALVAASLGMFAVACGSDSKADVLQSSGNTTGAPVTIAATTTPASTVPPTTTADATTSTAADAGDSGAVTSISDAQTGVIQIEAQGALRDPEVGQSVVGGRGSGFFISGDGYAVTNNHVVTGAATLEVFVGGDLSKSYNAQVVGVSECNDLALIKVSGQRDVPHFEWYEEPIKAGLEVYAAGFPLGDPEFTLTKGIVAKANAGADLTGLSSVDHTLEHDAKTHPGNSGGPLLTPDGEVVGVHYAGGDQGDGVANHYAIAGDLAQDVIDRLHDGDFESLGINGQAVVSEEQGFSGIWVGGIAAGTPAARVGLLPGDIVTTLNGLPLGSDGTFKDYCDVIRTAGADKPMTIEVLRYDTQEVLRGEINGTEELELSFSFAQTEGDEVEQSSAYTDYVSITDDTGSLMLEVPAEWADVDTTPVDVGDGTSLPRIEASTDLASFESSFDAPGVQFAALPSAEWPIEDVLAQFAQGEACTDGGISDYDDGTFAGKYQIWENCAGTDTIFVVLASTTIGGDGSATYLTSVQAVTSADLEALDHIMSTFNTTNA